MKVWKAEVPEVLMFEPDFFCKVEVGKWYFSSENLGPQGPFDTEKEAKVQADLNRQ